MKKEKGFTLVELLVVILILGILAAILLPNILGSRWKTTVFACKKNLSELGKTILTAERSLLIKLNSYRGSAKFWECLRDRKLGGSMPPLEGEDHRFVCPFIAMTPGPGVLTYTYPPQDAKRPLGPNTSGTTLLASDYSDTNHGKDRGHINVLLFKGTVLDAEKEGDVGTDVGNPELQPKRLWDRAHKELQGWVD